jgi:hypothetical protein
MQCNLVILQEETGVRRDAVFLGTEVQAERSLFRSPIKSLEIFVNSSPLEGNLVTIEKEAGWAPVPVCTL